MNSVSETGCWGKSTLDNQFSEKPTSGFGFSKTPNLEVYMNVESPSHLSQIQKEMASFPSEADLSQEHVIEVLLNNKKDPLSALKCFQWAKEQRGYVRGIN